MILTQNGAYLKRNVSHLIPFVYLCEFISKTNNLGFFKITDHFIRRLHNPFLEFLVLFILSRGILVHGGANEIVEMFQTTTSKSFS